VAQALDGSIDGARATFMLLTWDRDPDVMLASVLSNLPAAVPFIAHDALGAALGPAWPSPLDGTGLPQRCEDHGLVALPRREHEGHQLAAPFGPHMDFGTETTPAAAYGFGLWGPCFAPAAC
jgi:hypothetical protein